MSGKTLEIVGESLGGSRINIARIDGIATNFSGDYASLVMEKAVKMGESNACIAGASGGCQAEIGSASAMAAAGLAYLQGGDNDRIVNAMTLALKNMLGLTCDPVCGLVEVPCIKRNSAGAVNAVASAQLSLAGVKSAILADEVIDSMRRIGNDMPKCLKETGEGGLAVTETAQKLRAYQGSSEK